MTTVDLPPQEVDDEDNSGQFHHIVGLAFALFLLIVSISVIIISWGYGLGSEESLVGPGTVPVALGVLMAVTTLSIAIKDLKVLFQLRATADHEADTTGKTESQGHLRALNQELVRPVLILGTLGVGVFLGQFIGVLLALALVTFAVAVIFERVKLWKAGVMSVVTYALLYGIFIMLLPGSPLQNSLG